ncbi:MAG: hypothetical protein HY328_02245 [Chloroflexi bacterium]|nr:hypothetical protein [Chloroflexota bacterium]
MDAIASRIIKARQYVAERDQRIHVNSFEVQIDGDNAIHQVSYNRGIWGCDCEEFVRRGICAHVMAMEEILGDAVQPAMLAVV